MNTHDVWMAVIVGFECLRLGYEVSKADDLGTGDLPGRLFVSATMLTMLAFAWYFSQ